MSEHAERLRKLKRQRLFNFLHIFKYFLFYRFPALQKNSFMHKIESHCPKMSWGQVKLGSMDPSPLKFYVSYIQKQFLFRGYKLSSFENSAVGKCWHKIFCSVDAYQNDLTGCIWPCLMYMCALFFYTNCLLVLLFIWIENSVY